MNGCQYMKPKFSAPASYNTDQITWDYAFLSKEDFIKKHGEATWKKLSEDCG